MANRTFWYTKATSNTCTRTSSPAYTQLLSRDCKGAVRNRAGVEMGVVSHYVEAPAAPVMVVRGAREHWVPAVPSHLLRVDLERGEIEVDWPEDL